MEQINIRQLVLESIIEILEKGQYSHQVENAVLEKYAYLEKRDRAFYTRMIEGTLGSLITLDYYINQISKTPVKKQKPLIRNLLRISTYQILYMDSVPDSAAINEAVKLAKKRGFSQLSGFVNGVLRNLSRKKDEIVLPKAEDGFVTYASVRYSYPEWIVEQFVSDYGTTKCEEILAGLNEAQKMSVRVNTEQISVKELVEKLKEESINAEPIKGTDSGLFLSGVDRLSDLESFQSGDFYVQDASSMLVAEWANPSEGSYCIDVCAAPGGKSTHLAQMLHGTGHVDARDLTDYKVSLIQENISRLGLQNLSAKQWDATVLDENVCNRGDVVICDVPCSGLGVMGKKKDIRYHASKESIEELNEIQKKILGTVQNYVKLNGKLIYSTCTVCKKENEETVEWFQKQYPDFVLKEARQVFPHEVGNDGFFLAEFVRESQGAKV